MVDINRVIQSAVKSGKAFYGIGGDECLHDGSKDRMGYLSDREASIS
jgi:hypothetical protein